MTEELRDSIRQMLGAHGTLTLATCAAGRPWSSTVFFASDDAFNLYFVSDRRTRHALEMSANPKVALAINADMDNWSDVRGLQIEGVAQIVSGLQRPIALALYLGKFASVKMLFESPKSADEQAIAQRLRDTDFWCVTPNFIRLIDNRRGFGFKEELRL